MTLTLKSPLIDIYMFFPVILLFQTSPDGNVTLSTLNYIPSVRDAGKFMACRAENRELPAATLEDGWKLEIYCKISLPCPLNTILIYY